MTDDDNVMQSPEEFVDQMLPSHERLTRVVHTLLETILKDDNVDYLSITSRTKTKDTTLEKITRKSYSDPHRQLTDLSGIRIITYFDNQVRAISNLIAEIFDVDKPNSMDRSEVLGSDKVGYRSVHFVCTLGGQRKNIKEYKGLCDLKFEIQIRTVLQHAWAELTHDRSYKFSGVLPKALQRKLNLYAGMLEVVDEAFDQIALSADSYAENLRTQKDVDLGQEKLNSISFTEFLKKFTEKHDIEIRNISGPAMIIDELERFGIATIDELEKLLLEFVDVYKQSRVKLNDIAFVRGAMLHKDMEKYLSGEPDWSQLITPVWEILALKYEAGEIKKTLKKFGKRVQGDDR